MFHNEQGFRFNVVVEVSDHELTTDLSEHDINVFVNIGDEYNLTGEMTDCSSIRADVKNVIVLVGTYQDPSPPSCGTFHPKTTVFLTSPQRISEEVKKTVLFKNALASKKIPELYPLECVSGPEHQQYMRKYFTISFFL